MSDLTLKLSKKVTVVRSEFKKVQPSSCPPFPQLSLQNFKRNTRLMHKNFEELEQDFQERSEAAYRFGFEDGRKMGREDAKEEFNKLFNQMNQIANQLKEEKEKAVHEADALIVQLALSAAKSILRREVKIDPEVIGRIACEALKMVEDRRRVIIRIHPMDAQSIRNLEKEMETSNRGIKDFEIKEDPEVKPGGCLIESDSGIVDAQLEVQLEELGRRMLESI